MQGVHDQKMGGRSSSQGYVSSEFRSTKNAEVGKISLPSLKRRTHVKQRKRLAAALTVINALCACAYLFALLSRGETEAQTGLVAPRTSAEFEHRNTHLSRVPEGTRFVSLEIPLNGFSDTELSSQPFDLLFIHADERGLPRARVLYRNIKLISADLNSGTARISVADSDAPTLVALTQMGSFRLILAGGDAQTGEGAQSGTEQGPSGVGDSGFDLPLSDRPWVSEVFQTDQIEILE